MVHNLTFYFLPVGGFCNNVSLTTLLRRLRLNLISFSALYVVIKLYVEVFLLPFSCVCCFAFFLFSRPGFRSKAAFIVERISNAILIVTFSLDFLKYARNAPWNYVSAFSSRQKSMQKIKICVQSTKKNPFSAAAAFKVRWTFPLQSFSPSMQVNHNPTFIIIGTIPKYTERWMKKIQFYKTRKSKLLHIRKS